LVIEYTNNCALADVTGDQALRNEILIRKAGPFLTLPLTKLWILL
jgi:hypothetical protein